MEIQEFNNKMVDKIATYLEQEENWSRMKDACLEYGVSYDLRRLLREAINQSNEV